LSGAPSADIPQFEISSGPGPNDVYVVRVAGEVDMSHEEELRALLLSREEKVPEKGGESLAVATSSEQILRILSVMGLDQVLPIEPTVERAAAALSG
jgi:hypothetical protein